jgi:hypothetical protein
VLTDGARSFLERVCVDVYTYTPSRMKMDVVITNSKHGVTATTPDFLFVFVRSREMDARDVEEIILDRSQPVA